MAFHPTQVPMIESAYTVDVEDYEMAISLSDQNSPAVFRMHNAMCEVATHQQWAINMINRQQCYGVNEALLLKEYAELSF
jgi:citrate lyase beta subunit